VLPGRAVRRLREPDVIQPVEDPVEADPRFGARQCLTRTRVDAATERHVIAGVRALDVELVGLVEVARVAIDRARHDHQRGPGRNGHAGQLGRPAGQAERRLRRTLQPQRLLDERHHERAVVTDARLELRPSGEPLEQRRHHVRGRALPGGEQERGDAHDVDHLGHRPVGEGRERELRHDVVAR
jgi:hypothetical protein